MITTNYRGGVFSLFTSILIHFLVIIFFFINKNEIEKITVVDLATFRENTLVNQLNNQSFLFLFHQLSFLIGCLVSVIYQYMGYFLVTV